MVSSTSSDRADAVEQTFRVSDGLYLLGSLEKGLTVYNQQVRAHNLAWALWTIEQRLKADADSLGKVAIVGGGIAGLTLAAGLLAQSRGRIPITLFEQRWDLCPLQQGCDARWLHPRIYNWPHHGSRAPGASLPLLNWSEGRASDVARSAVRQFGECCDAFEDRSHPLAVLLGLRHFRVNTQRREINWIGTRTKRSASYFRDGRTEGGSATFGTIILTAGFGIEREEKAYPTSSYWRNEQIGQPVLDGRKHRYVVSGYGDGALIDLCRLKIERFRQDTIVYELFGPDLEAVERQLSADVGGHSPDDPLLDYFEAIERRRLGRALKELRRRIRKDTEVMLYIGGQGGRVKSFSEVFGPTSSFLNRLLTYLLYRCGAFAIGLENLDECVRRFDAWPEHVLCRHGADTIGHLRAMIDDFETIEDRLKAMRTNQAQKPVPVWAPGTFPIPTQGHQR